MRRFYFLAASLFILVSFISFVSAADYNQIHASRPRLWMTSNDSFTSIHDKINSDSTMLARWNTFIGNAQKTQWSWGAKYDGDFYNTFAQILIGKVESDSSWYTTGAIPNNAQSLSLFSSFESDSPYQVMAQALTYDWLYNELTPTQRTTIRQNLENACDIVLNGQDDSTQNEDYHNYHTGWISAVAIAGIALYGDSSRAEAYLNWSLGRMYEDGKDKNDNIYYNFMKSMKATDGYCMFEGPGYFKDAIPEMAFGIEAWDAATNRYYNLWNSETYFKKMENAGYSVIYMHTPAMRRFKEEDSTYGENNYVTSYNMDLLSLMEKSFSNGYFLNFLNDKWSSVSDWGSWDGGQTGRRAFYFLWVNPSVPSLSYANLAKDQKMGEYTILKNGWTTNDPYIVFKAGYHWKAHAQSDHGNFQIYLGNELMTGKSGWYATSSWDVTSHRMAWTQQTISGNCLTIYDSSELQQYSVYGTYYPNSGGQRLMNFMITPPFSGGGTLSLGGGAMLSGGGHNVADSTYGVTNRYEELARYGTVLASELNQNDYAYTKADITNGYTNAYSGYGNNIKAKANLVQRSLVYLRPNFVVVSDIVNTSNSNLQVSFITHQPNAPELYSGSWNAASTGINNYQVSNARWTLNGSRIFQNTLYPTSNVNYHTVGGPGYGFYIENTSTNYPPEGGYLIYFDGGYTSGGPFVIGETVTDPLGGRGKVFYVYQNYGYAYLTTDVPFTQGQTVTGSTSGARAVISSIHAYARQTSQDPELLPWRIEIRPTTGITNKYNFLNVLEIAKSTKDSASFSLLINSTDGKMQGAFINNSWAVMFAKNNELINQTQYLINSTQTVKNLVVDLRPSTVYYIYDNGALMRTATSSSQGTLFFNVSTGSHTVRISETTTSYHAADGNMNNYIELTELMSYIRQFKLGTVTRTNVLDGVMNFFKGHYQ